MRKNHFLCTTIEGTLINAVRQTKDGKFNGTYLLQRCNEMFGTHKTIDDYFRSKSTREYFSTIWWFEVGKMDTPNLGYQNLQECKKDYAKMTEKQFRKSDAFKYCVKSVRGGNEGTYLHPYAYKDLGTWASTELKYALDKLIMDNVIKFRLDTADYQTEMIQAFGKIGLNKWQAISLNRALNMAVYGCELNEARGLIDSKAEEDLLADRKQMQKTIIDMVDAEIFNEYNDIVYYLRKQCKKRYNKEMYKKDRL